MIRIPALLSLLLLLPACTSTLGLPPIPILPLPEPSSNPTLSEVFVPCEEPIPQAEDIEDSEDPALLIHGARCLGYKVLHDGYIDAGESYEDDELADLMEEDEGSMDTYARYQDALDGAELAERAAALDSGNGLAHYVAAYLVGLAAESNPYEGLALVPRMEDLALEAARLAPNIDNGGPDRMLGELYLRAPEFPMSVGDTTLAVEHYRLALDMAPDYTENKLGLARSLYADGEEDAACEMYTGIIESGDDLSIFPDWSEDMKTLDEACFPAS